VGVGLDLAAQPVDVAVDGVLVPVMAITPHEVEQLRAGVDAAWVLGKLHEQVELTRGQIDGTARNAHAALRAFDDDVACRDDLVGLTGL